MFVTSTTKAIHLLRHHMEKYRKINKGLHMVFIDLEKTYDNIPQETILRTLEVKGSLVSCIVAIFNMYCQSTIYVRTPVKDTYYSRWNLGSIGFSDQHVYSRDILRVPRGVFLCMLLPMIFFWWLCPGLS